MKYAGQLVELTSTSLTATNDFQSLDIQLFKNEESISSWNNNKPELEVIQGNNKVFGIFTREAQNLSDSLQVSANALVAYQAVKDGKATFELQLPQGKYYMKELDTGTYHVGSDKEYDFEFTAENNHATFPIHIYQDTVAYGRETMQKITRSPILNKLHFNQFTIKKVNERAVFDKNTLVYDYDALGNGAVFTLENTDGDILQEVTITKDGLGIFEQIPIGTFFLKEKAPSSDDFLVSNEVIRIESTKDGIKAFNEKNELFEEQPATAEETEATILFELKNHLIKGTAELEKKDVSTGKLLPDTGVRILDKGKNVLIEGRTDENGVFRFKELPKGLYYFQEFDAPEGYQLDETPMQFEIKEHGEVVKCEMTNKKIETPKTLETPTQNSFHKTGDTTNIALAVMGLVLSASVMGVVYFRRKKGKAE